MKNLEIERKFLLKRIPNFLANDVKEYSMIQIYVEIDGKINRFRKTEKLKDGSVCSVNYVHCIKSPISEGVFEEIEKPIDEFVFDEMIKENHRFIVKNRTVYEANGLKWEIDEYDGINLVTLEVELDDINQAIEIPDLINKEIISEVTGNRNFSNYSLSEEG